MITVLITTYNDAYHLNKCIKSVLFQRYKRFELLIIDDGSTDSTESIIKKYDDNRIRYVKTEHRGRSAALNYGLKIAKYDWIFLLDADDLILPHTLKRYSEYITSSTNTVISSFTCFYKNNRLLFYLDYPTNDDEIKIFLHLHSINNTVLYNRQFILNTITGYNESLINSEEDYDLWLRAFDQITFIIIPEYLTIKGFRNDSFSKREASIKKKKIYLLQEKFYNRMNFSIINEDYELLGWREFFYGSKGKTREYFYKLGIQLLKKPKILTAILLTKLPEKLLHRILLHNYYPRIQYKLKYFSNKFIVIRKFIKAVNK